MNRESSGDEMTFDIPRDMQCLVYCKGDGSALWMTDSGENTQYARKWSFSEIERALLVTRLRTWADLIERVGRDKAMGLNLESIGRDEP